MTTLSEVTSQYILRIIEEIIAEATAAAWQEGYDDGWQDGHDAGWDEGYEAGVDACDSAGGL